MILQNHLTSKKTALRALSFQENRLWMNCLVVKTSSTSLLNLLMFLTMVLRSKCTSSSRTGFSRWLTVAIAALRVLYTNWHLSVTEPWAFWRQATSLRVYCRGSPLHSLNNGTVTRPRKSSLFRPALNMVTDKQS